MIANTPPHMHTIRVVMLSVTAATATPLVLPWEYNWTSFPAVWFGGNGTDWESPEQIAAIGKYQMAILGWQDLLYEADWTAVVYTQLTQAAIIKDAHPHIKVMVYAGFGFAFGLNAAVWSLMQDAAYSDFFLQQQHGAEFTHTNCEQMHQNNPHCVGWFWKFSNASARQYFVEEVVLPLATAPMIDGVFFDAFNYGWDIPEVRPFGLDVVNVPNCTHEGGAGCDALVQGSIDVAVATTRLLNQHQKVPMFANPGSFVRGLVGTNIWLNESALVDALDGLSWLTYYESARAEQMFALPPRPLLPPDALFDNMVREGSLGVAAAMHAYYHADVNGTAEDVTQHIVAFMMVREQGWYYLGSTGWLDKDYRWSSMYDMRCGRPVAAASRLRAGVYVRQYEACAVRIDCTQALNTTAKPQPPCNGSITGAGAVTWDSSRARFVEATEHHPSLGIESSAA